MVVYQYGFRPTHWTQCCLVSRLLYRAYSCLLHWRVYEGVFVGGYRLFAGKWRYCANCFGAGHLL